jgi:hypothetical protein
MTDCEMCICRPNLIPGWVGTCCSLSSQVVKYTKTFQLVRITTKDESDECPGFMDRRRTRLERVLDGNLV